MGDLKSELKSLLAEQLLAQPASAQKSTKMVVHARAAPLEKHREQAARVQELVDAADSPATLRAYDADWRLFVKWCTDEGHSTKPVAPETVSFYLERLFAVGKKGKTIERALYGIIFTLRSQGIDWETPPFIKKQLKGIRKKLAQAGKHSKPKDPLEKSDFERIMTLLPIDLRGARDRAVLAILWIGAFRRSEVAGLDVSDVKFVPREGLLVRPKTSKTDQTGEDEGKALPLQQNLDVCPVHALRAWLDAAKIDAGPLFRRVYHDGRIGKGRLSDKSVAEIVKRAAKLAGLDPTKYSGHSPRAGFATSAAADGIELDGIMRQTGHKSVAVVRGYIRHGTMFTKNAAKGMFK